MSGSLRLMLLLLTVFNQQLFAQSSLNGAQLILEYQRVISMVAEQDNAMRMQVFADGRVHVHYPAISRRAGDYEVSLDAAALNRLMNSMYTLGVAEFDPSGVNEEIRQFSREADAASRLRLVRTDQDMTYIRILADRGMHEFGYRGLRGHSESFPQVNSLVDLSAAVQQLDSLMREISRQ